MPHTLDRRLGFPVKTAQYDSVVYRAQSLLYGNNPLSSIGAREFGGRFNKIGVAVNYFSECPHTAYLEFQDGLGLAEPLPCIIFGVKLSIKNYVDLTAPKSMFKGHWLNWSSDWSSARDDYKSGKTSATCDSWKCGQDVYVNNCTGILYPSAVNKRKRNFAVFPDTHVAGCLKMEVIDSGGIIEKVFSKFT